MVLNQKSIKTADIEKWIDDYMADRPNLGMMGLMIHEEYYYEDYSNYISDCGERILKAIKHVYDKGFRSVPIEQICFE